MNNWIGIGNLTKNPELRYSTGQNQTAVCRFTLAINDKRKNPQTGQWEENPSFVPVVVFGKQAENCGRYLVKGKKVAVSGRIQTGSYEKDGQKVHTTEVVASGVEFLTPKNEQPQQTNNQEQTFNQEQQSFETQNIPAGFEQMQEEIPF